MAQTDLAIVIPAYKGTFLRETLESVARQTDRRFHLYIGDDCSPHGLNEIVKDFEGRIPMTYHRFDTNLGGTDLVAQWERCIALTQGEPWIWLFSDDDVMGPECVREFYEVPEDVRKNAVIHFSINIINDKSTVIKRPAEYPAQISAEEYLYLKLNGKIISYVVEFIFPRAIYDHIGGFVNFDLAWGSDFMTWLRMATESERGIMTVKPTEKAMVNWRMSTENISPNKTYAIEKRKIESLIGNAAYIRALLKQYPKHYDGVEKEFRFVKFPFGEILRNRNLFTLKEIHEFTEHYRKRVGFTTHAIVCELYILISKYLLRHER